MTPVRKGVMHDGNEEGHAQDWREEEACSADGSVITGPHGGNGLTTVGGESLACDDPPTVRAPRANVGLLWKTNAGPRPGMAPARTEPARPATIGRQAIPSQGSSDDRAS